MAADNGKPVHIERPALIEKIESQLRAMVRAKTGDAGARISDVSPLPGHAGIGRSFVLSSTGGKNSRKLVLRVAPQGVRISGPTDVVRQARIMQSVAPSSVQAPSSRQSSAEDSAAESGADEGIPVPPILWYGDEPEFFGAPYFVDEFVDGFKLHDVQLPADETHQYACAAVAALARLHRTQWEPVRSIWGEPVALIDELKRLDDLLGRPALDWNLGARIPQLRERLGASIPQSPRIGCVHGDFQWLNILLAQRGVAAIIDWELAMIGPVMLDVGWLCLFSDPQSWLESGLVGDPALRPEEIVEAYAQCTGDPVTMDEVKWYRAFSGFRFGVITLFNLMLHRRGKREDAAWEQIALSAPGVFDRAIDLLED